MIRFFGLAGLGFALILVSPFSASGQTKPPPFTVDNVFPDFYVIPIENRSLILDQGTETVFCGAYATAAALATILPNNPKRLQVLPANMIADPRQLFSDSGGVQSFSPIDGQPGHLVKKAVTMALAQAVALPDRGFSLVLPMPGYSIKVGSAGIITENTPLRPAGMTRWDVMRKFLFSHGALIANFTILSDLDSYKRGIYHHDKTLKEKLAPIADEAARQRVRTELGTRVGDHIVAVVGYFVGGKLKQSDFASIFGLRLPPFLTDSADDYPAFWIVQNSWGRKWGLDGIFFYAADQPLSEKLDDAMVYLLDPTVTFNGQQILP